MNSRKVLSLVTTLSIIFNFLTPIRIFADNAITGGSDTTGGISVNVAISDWQITGSGTIPVHLYVPSGTLSMTTTTGLTFTGASSGSNLYFSGSLEDINNALTTLQYLNGSAGTYTIELSLVAAGQIIYPATGHVYEVINNGSSITATAARAAALARSYNNEGIVWGYLANITSSEEDAFVGARLTQDGWFGASDEGSEGTWQWRDGPEAGTTFWTGLFDGVASGYENWSRYNDTGEPNDSGNEDCSEYYSDGSGWNDLPCDIPGSITTYVVEYGDTIGGGGPSSAADSLDVTIVEDIIPPTITSISSDKADGYYKAEEVIDIDVTFSEVVTSTGDVTVTLETGDTDRTCTFSVTSSTTGTCNYTVQEGDNTDDLTVLSVAGVIKDGANNTMVNFVPATNLAANKAIVIDTTAPNAPAVQRPSNHEKILSATSLTEGTCETGATVSIGHSNLATNPTTVTCSGGTFSTNITFSSGLNSEFTLSITQIDLAGNTSNATEKIVRYAAASGGGGGKTTYPGCRDDKAINYDPESTHKAELCEYKKIETLPVTEIQTESSNTITETTVLNNQTQESGLVLNSAPTQCTISKYTTEIIKLGRKNNPEQVKFLEHFLNKYENIKLPIDGIYSKEDFNAVIKWQEKYTDDILKPWGLKKGTGYVFKTSLAKIKEIEDGACDKAEQK